MTGTPPKCVAIDVDGTLVTRGCLNHKVADWAKARKSDGYEVLLWSSRGKRHAKDIAEHFKIKEYFTSIISKPSYIVDDKGWAWIKFTRVIFPWNIK